MVAYASDTLKGKGNCHQKINVIVALQLYVKKRKGQKTKGNESKVTAAAAAVFSLWLVSKTES